jgi:hypothetical protein
MAALRRRIVGIAALTLTLQIAGLAMAPAALCCVAGAEQQTTMNCCKDAGPGHICPLMKKKGQSSQSGATLRACCSLEDQLFTALFGLLGLPAPSATGLTAPAVTLSIVAASASTYEWLAPADSPPPRA